MKEDWKKYFFWRNIYFTQCAMYHKKMFSGKNSLFLQDLIECFFYSLRRFYQVHFWRLRAISNEQGLSEWPLEYHISSKRIFSGNNTIIVIVKYSFKKVSEMDSIIYYSFLLYSFGILLIQTSVFGLLFAREPQMNTLQHTHFNGNLH